MSEKIKLQDKVFRVMIPAEEIDRAVDRVAEQLNERYAGRTPVFLGVLSGSFLFMSDLVRKTTFDSQLAFVKISSYQGTESTGEVKQQLGVDFDIEMTLRILDKSRYVSDGDIDTIVTSGENENIIGNLLNKKVILY